MSRTERWILDCVPQPFDAIVLAGGAARRLGGIDKATLVVGGRTLLNRVVDACDGAGRVVVVGPVRPTHADVVWCREEPAGGGPVSAIAAGLDAVGAPLVVVLACDLPYVTPAAVDDLVAAASTGHDGVVYADKGGRAQPLVGVYWRASLRRALRGVVHPYGGAALREVTEQLTLMLLPDEVGASRDCDTWDDVEEARRAQEVGR